MFIKLLVILIMVLILAALGSGLYYLTKEDPNGTHMVKALTWRIGLSISLFIFLLIAFGLGWITPHSV